MGVVIMKVWVNTDGWLVNPYVNAPKPAEFIEIELSAANTSQLLNGTIFKYVNGALIEHSGVVVSKKNSG
jgi:hypothetical protein